MGSLTRVSTVASVTTQIIRGGVLVIKGNIRLLMNHTLWKKELMNTIFFGGEDITFSLSETNAYQNLFLRTSANSTYIISEQVCMDLFSGFCWIYNLSNQPFIF